MAPKNKQDTERKVEVELHSFEHQDKKQRRSASESNLINKCEVEAAEAAEEDGFYKSYDELADDIAMSVLATSNPLEASVVLRPHQKDPAAASACSSATSASDTAARCSFNSSDSGRTSCGGDTYGETSNSSVASAASNSTSSHSNRLYSNTSNCSGDSGMSAGSGSSDCSNGNGGNRVSALEVLQENEIDKNPSVYGVVKGLKENGIDSMYSQIDVEEERYFYSGSNQEWSVANHDILALLLSGMLR